MLPSLPCFMCTRIFSTHADYTSHLRTHLHPQPFRCMLCGERFSEPKRLSAHAEKHVQDENVKAPPAVRPRCPSAPYDSLQRDFDETKETPPAAQRRGRSVARRGSVRAQGPDVVGQTRLSSLRKRPADASPQEDRPAPTRGRRGRGQPRPSPSTRKRPADTSLEDCPRPGRGRRSARAGKSSTPTPPSSTQPPRRPPATPPLRPRSRTVPPEPRPRAAPSPQRRRSSRLRRPPKWLASESPPRRRSASARRPASAPSSKETSQGTRGRRPLSPLHFVGSVPPPQAPPGRRPRGRPRLRAPSASETTVSTSGRRGRGRPRSVAPLETVSAVSVKGRPRTRRGVSDASDTSATSSSPRVVRGRGRGRRGRSRGRRGGRGRGRGRGGGRGSGQERGRGSVPSRSPEKDRVPLENLIGLLTRSAEQMSPQALFSVPEERPRSQSVCSRRRRSIGFLCNLCGKRFSREVALQYHKIFHG